MEKRRKGAISPLFHNIFNISLTSIVQLHIHLLNAGSIYFFLKSANLICRSTDISKHFRESLGIQDNESRLYPDFLLERKSLVWNYDFTRTVLLLSTNCMNAMCLVWIKLYIYMPHLIEFSTHLPANLILLSGFIYKFIVLADY